MVAAEAASEASVFERMIDVVVTIVTAGIMPDPAVVVFNVGSFPMFILLLLPARLLNSGRSGTMSRNVPAAKTVTTTAAMAAAMLPAAPALRDIGNQKHQTDCKKADSAFHATPPIAVFACRMPQNRGNEGIRLFASSE